MNERVMKRCVGRPIPEWDMVHRLPIDRAVGPDMWESGTIFRFNSTYMDVTDQGHMENQWTMVSVLAGSFAVGFEIALAFMFHSIDMPVFMYWAPVAFVSVFTFITVRFGGGGMFALTRSPIRFNRKERKTFSMRGRRYLGAKSAGDHVWEIPWNEHELFCLHKERTTFGAVFHIRHYSVDQAGDVTRAFCIGREWGGETEVEILLAQWNYWCAFMNFGPQAFPKPMLFQAERETPRESFLFCLYGFGLIGTLSWRLFTMPLALILAPLRMLAIATSRAPIWPEAIEKISQIEANDAYAEPRPGTPVGWAETVLAQRRGEYPTAPQRKTEGQDVMFSLTRRPIRFHRNAGKLFAVQRRRYFGAAKAGDFISEIPWSEDEIFCLHKDVTIFGTMYHVRHYAVDGSGKVTSAISIGREWTENPEIELVLAQWNYWVAFMNAGPQAIPKPMLFHSENETPRESFLYSLYSFGLTTSTIARMVFMSVVLIFTPLRMLANATSRAPIWPVSIATISQVDPSDTYSEPKQGTPVGWAETVLAQQDGKYPDAPQRKTDGWSGLKDGARNAELWALDEPPDNVAGYTH